VIGIRGDVNCKYQTGDDKYIYVRTKGLTFNKKGNRIESFLNDIPVLERKPSEPGIYTWIVYTSSNPVKQFAACKTYSFMELGTKHHIIAYRVGAKRIHAAGELYIDADGHTSFNLQSGTYMKKLFENFRKAECKRNEFELYVLDQLKTEFLGQGSLYVKDSFIVNSLIPTEEELALFDKHNLLRLFETEEECNQFDEIDEETEENQTGGKPKNKSRRTRRKTHRRRLI